MNKIERNETFLVATHNKGKATEFRELFQRVNVSTKFSFELNIEEPIENGKSFEENSIIKAKSCSGLNYNVISDDSGLCVNCLNGEPGIYSARWAKLYGGWENAMHEIYKRILKTKNNDFSAKYCCVLTILWKNGHINTFYGEIEGQIVWPPRGDNGFGYDPFFMPSNKNKTFGELEKKVKMDIDHRSIAFNKILKNHFSY